MRYDVLKAGARWFWGGALALVLSPALAQPSSALLAAAPPAPVAPSPAPAPGSLDGIWKGPLPVPGGQLELIFRLVKLSSGDYFATLDVPQQKVSRVAVRVESRADTVRFIAAEVNSRFIGRRSADGQHLTGIWQQPGFQTPLTLQFVAAPPPAALARNARLTPPYREEEVAFDSPPAAGLHLSGQLTVPAGPGPFPAVVLLSDAGPQDRNGTTEGFMLLGRLADYLTRRGIAVLRFDDRGVGQSTGPAGPTAAERVADAQTALRYLRTRPELDGAHLGLIGHGEGGNVALLAASQSLPPAFVVTLAAAGLPGTAVAMQQHATRLRLAGVGGAPLSAALKRAQAVIDAIRTTADNAQAQVSVASLLRQSNPALAVAAAQARATEMTSNYYRTYLTFNPVPKLLGVNCPVLLLHGADDQTVDADTNLTALTNGLVLIKDKVVAKKLPGLNHLFQPDPAQWPIVSGQRQATFSPEAEEVIRGWIAEHVKK